VDAGIPQAEAPRKSQRACVVAIRTFRGTCTRVHAHISARSGALDSPNRRLPKSLPARRATRDSFKTALDLARTFPFGVLASHVLHYCYNIGHSSPGGHIRAVSVNVS